MKSDDKNEEFKAIGIVSKPLKDKNISVLNALIKWLEEKGKKVFLDKDTASFAENFKGTVCRKSDLPNHVELIIVLGGDGTFLSVARIVIKKNIPILGVNLGSLGFLTETPLDNMYNSLDAVFTGQYKTDQRLMLRAHVHRQGERIAEYTALNDIVINKGAIARIITMSTYVDHKFVTTYRADGLIISSPTGSTAYSLAAGGPIIYPDLDVIVVSPICPHSLGNRSIVIPASCSIEITLESQTEDVFLTLDGQVGFTLRANDVVEIKKADTTIKLIQNLDRNYFEILRTKLGWGDS